MSRAFVKETDEISERLPEKPISPHPNLVTPGGLELIEATLGRLREERATALGASDHAAQLRIERDLRYWAARGNGPSSRAPKRFRDSQLRLHSNDRTQ